MILGGEVMDLDEVVRQHGEALLRYATGVTGNFADAQDAVQDMLIAAGEGWKDVKNMRAWLYKITLNKCLNIRRRRRWLFFSDLPAEPHEIVPIQNDMPIIMQALAPMKPLHRAILYLRAVEGYSYEELAEITAQKPATLRKIYERARQRAAVLLKNFKED
jgi:RNA polymerase sigma-70 factor (ECF subfamily)